MTEQERKNRLQELIKASEKRMKRLENAINEIWDDKKKKPKKGFEQEFKDLKKDLLEEVTIFDCFKYVETELEI